MPKHSRGIRVSNDQRKVVIDPYLCNYEKTESDLVGIASMIYDYVKTMAMLGHLPCKRFSLR